MRERERPRGLQLPLRQPLCCALGKQKGNGHATVQLLLVVPLHPLLSGSAGWPWKCLEMHGWRCTTVSVPNMVWISVSVRTVPYQGGQWWCFSSVENHRYFNQEYNSACMAATSVLCFLPLSQAGPPSHHETMIWSCTSSHLSCLPLQTKPMLKSTGRQHPWLWIVNTNLAFCLSVSLSLLLSWQALSQLSSRRLSCIYEGGRDNSHSSCLQGFSWVSRVCCSISPCLSCLEYRGKEASEGV